jgi:type IV pilus assembly protein PilC
MPIFFYRAKDASGEILEKKMEAADRFAVYRKIKEGNQIVISVKEESAVKSKIIEKAKSLLSKVKTPEKIAFARNLGTMIKAGLSVTRAISVMEKQTRNRKLKSILISLSEGVSKGQPLSESMKNHQDMFSTLFVSMVRSGEESGNLAGSLKVVALQMEKSYLLAKKVKGAMLYPIIIISLMIVIGVLMMVYMVPTLTETFKGLGVDLPLSTRVIIFISDFLRSSYLLIIALVVAMVPATIGFAHSKKGKRFLNKLILKIPIIGNLAKEINAARTARTLSSLLSSGVDIVVAIGVTQEVLQNVFYKEVLNEAQKSVEKGDPMSSVFVRHEDLYPVFVGEMVSVGEETGQMSEMLLNVATFYENEVDQKTKDMSTIIEPLLMIIIGVGVGLFAISMLSPTYSLVEKI